MAKLLFESDDGSQHEISLKTISSKGLTKGDIVFVNYEVGGHGESIVRPEMQKLQTFFEKLLPEGVKCVVIAMRDGKEDISIKIVKDKT